MDGGCTACKKFQEDTLIVKKLDFVLFMADVINGAAQINSRTDRIRIIIKSAKKLLNVQRLEWGNVVDYFNESEANMVEESSQYQSC